MISSNKNIGRTPKRLIFKELHEILNIFRTIFVDEKSIYNEIDEVYEETLVSSLQMVPEQFDELIMKYINLVKVLVNNINFDKLSNDLERFDGEYDIPHIEINSIKLFEEGLNNTTVSKINKARTMNIVNKLVPIFKCVDVIISMPKKVLRKIANLQKINDTNIL